MVWKLANTKACMYCPKCKRPIEKNQEKELPFYLHGYDPPGYFNEFRTKLCELTSMTRNYFKNLVQALEWPG
ncbi:hypothetical protein IFM89_010665 [Coptis chinensis]|uniref:Uncharacterized protein n=1 Tax=Coptis chinensis TaxID=261450 RepID=A0A835HAN2_9MAGN|nr:hypothetical protein IFM89_010665 [Coptis chinensis]